MQIAGFTRSYDQDTRSIQSWYLYEPNLFGTEICFSAYASGELYNV